MELTNRRAVVVGAASGVGRGAASALASAGMTVLAADIDLAGARELTAADPSGRIHPAHVDATDRESLSALCDHVSTLWGPGAAVDLLVVTVGVMDSQPVDQITEQLWAWAWEVNVMAPPSRRAAQRPPRHFQTTDLGLQLPDLGAFLTGHTRDLTGVDLLLLAPVPDRFP